MKKLLNLTELSKHVSIPKRTLFNMITDGRFPVKPVEGLRPRRWSVELVDAWMNGKGGK